MSLWQVSMVEVAALVLGALLGYAAKECQPHADPALERELHQLEDEVHRLVAIETAAGKYLFQMARDGNRMAQRACDECWPGVQW